MDAVPAQVLCAESPRTSHVPTYRYWDETTGRWGRFDQATRYRPDALPSIEAALPDAGAHVAWMPDLPTDLDGLPYTDDTSMGPWRVTLCCAAAVGIDDGPLYCKSCYEPVSLAFDTPARLDGDWTPGDGPQRFRLPPT